MKKLLTIFIILFAFSGFSQILTDGSGDIVASPYRYIKDDISAWTAGTGTYINGSDATRDYIECTSAGTMGISSMQAYDTWEWDAYKLDAGTIYIQPIKDGITINTVGNGYYIGNQSAENIYMGRTLAGTPSSLFTATNYNTGDTWYSYRLTRSASGVFTYYIRGGEFGNIWSLVNVTSGSNPVIENTITTSTYFVIHCTTGGRISNIRFKDDYKTILLNDYIDESYKEINLKEYYNIQYKEAA